MKIVRATMKCFVGGRLRHPGEEFEYDGPPQEYLEVVKKVQVSAPKEPTPRRRKTQEEE